jgi:hypothetical protein
MQILFLVSILCFLVLVWAGISMARHIHTGQKTDRVPAEVPATFAQHLLAAAEERSLRSGHPVHQQTIRELSARKNWNTPHQAVLIQPAHESDTSSPINGRRKGPKASHHGTAERLDWEFFNKDAGDLSDPYQPRRLQAASGANATSQKRF